MHALLNFGVKEKHAVKKLLAQYKKKETKTVHEEARAIVGTSTVTLYTSGRVTIQGLDADAVKALLLRRLTLTDELVLGIDEAGRGESYGSFVIGGVLAYKKDMLGLRDSKKIKDLKKRVDVITKKALSTAVVSFSSAHIDDLRKQGFTLNDLQAQAMNAILAMHANQNPIVRVDGTPLKGVKKGVEFIIQGDDKDPVIGAASVLAKYTRDESKDQAERKTWKGKTHRKVKR